jgi:fumarylacetoacetate (FAA) hydrolase
MKLATLKNGYRDGALAVVSRDLKRAVTVPDVASTLQAALDDWAAVSPVLEDVSEKVNRGIEPGLFAFDPAQCMAPLPRAYQWADGSAYIVHVELVRRARNAEVPKSFYTNPLVYQGGSDDFLGPCDAIPVLREDMGIDLEAEVAVITDDVPMTTDAAAARNHIRLVMLVNDVSLRNLIPAELEKGFGFYNSKPSTAFSPVAVTPDELGSAWDGGKVNLPLRSYVRGKPFGHPNAGQDMTFDFPRLIQHLAQTRNLRAGTIIGSGTVANRNHAEVGSSCLAEVRALEMIEFGAPRTPFLKFGERVRIEMLDDKGNSIFGAIDQQVVQAHINEKSMVHDEAV